MEPITGKPYKPTTQGKNERFHQTLFRFLNKQPIAETLEQLQAQVDAFDAIYNAERPHQALPGRITAQQAWEATPKVEAPRPVAPSTPVVSPSDEIRVKKTTNTDAVEFRGIRFGIGRARA
ncbi:integrase core domain-containing protein [Gryllotalpicola daejeonensis]|uniref:integrase core domain-containing protein n=1 Tax=Gryllotalpicola daejeonensis TaxID=993087 RepID=UPI003CD07134